MKNRTLITEKIITTIDGVNKKIGQPVYCISFSNQTVSYYPEKHFIDIMDNGVHDHRYFDDKNLCQEQCNLMNAGNKI